MDPFTGGAVLNCLYTAQNLLELVCQFGGRFSASVYEPIKIYIADFACNKGASQHFPVILCPDGIDPIELLPEQIKQFCVDQKLPNLASIGQMFDQLSKISGAKACIFRDVAFPEKLMHLLFQIIAYDLISAVKVTVKSHEINLAA